MSYTLFTIDMFSCLSGCNSYFSMMKIRGGNHNCIDIFTVNQLLVSTVTFYRKWYTRTTGTHRVPVSSQSIFCMKIKYITDSCNNNVQILLCKPIVKCILFFAFLNIKGMHKAQAISMGYSPVTKADNPNTY